MMIDRTFFVVFVMANAVLMSSLKAKNCGQNVIDGTTMPTPAGYYYITPTLGVLPSPRWSFKASCRSISGKTTMVTAAKRR
jgi:hypothetical protein